MFEYLYAFWTVPAVVIISTIITGWIQNWFSTSKGLKLTSIAGAASILVTHSTLLLGAMI